MSTGRTRTASSRREELRRAAILSSVPATAALALGALLLPRAGIPEAVPLPLVDPGALERTAGADRALARAAEAAPLPAPVRALGSALRDFHLREASEADRASRGERSEGNPAALAEARGAVDRALIDAQAAGPGPLLELRAVELEAFEREVLRFEATGVESLELRALSGSFIRAMQREGWLSSRRSLLGAPKPKLAPDSAALRAMFKEMWTRLVGLAAEPEFALSLDEARALYAFYLSHPHLPAGQRTALDAARRGAQTEPQCQAAFEAERSALEAFRIERIGQLAVIDPAYPAAYAKGVVELRRSHFAAAEEALRSWLDSHPDGPYTLRARTYLRAAVRGQRAD